MSTNIEVIKAVKSAVRADATMADKWKACGHIVSAHYTEATFTESKAQFIADAILPALGEDAVRIMGTDQFRKGSAQYLEFCAKDSTYAAEWQAANEAKRNIRAQAHTMFSRVAKYAWPATDDGQPAVKRELATRLAEELAKLIKACESSEDDTLYLPLIIQHLQAALQASQPN